MRILNVLANGFPSVARSLAQQERIFQQCVAIELEKQSIQFLREQEMPQYYERAVGTGPADFIVENAALIELKAVITLEDMRLAQGLNYLEAYRIKNGLLLNFGPPGLEAKRLFWKHTQAKNIKSRSSLHPDHPDSDHF